MRVLTAHLSDEIGLLLDLLEMLGVLLALTGKKDNPVMCGGKRWAYGKSLFMRIRCADGGGVRVDGEWGGGRLDLLLVELVDLLLLRL